MLKLFALALLYVGVSSSSTQKKTFIIYLSGNVEDDVEYEEAFQIEFPEQMYDHCSDSFIVHEAAYIKDPPKDKQDARGLSLAIISPNCESRVTAQGNPTAPLNSKQAFSLRSHKTIDLSTTGADAIYYKGKRKPLMREEIKKMKLKRTTKTVRSKKLLKVKTSARPPKAVLLTNIHNVSNRVILPPAKMKIKAPKRVTTSKKKLRKTKERKVMRKEVGQMENKDLARKTEELLAKWKRPKQRLRKRRSP